MLFHIPFPLSLWLCFYFYLITEYGQERYGVSSPSSQTNTQHIIPSAVCHQTLIFWAHSTFKRGSLASYGSLCVTIFKVWYTEAYSEHYQTHEMERFWESSQSLSYLVGFYIHICIHWVLSQGIWALFLSRLGSASIHRWCPQLWFSRFVFSTHFFDI